MKAKDLAIESLKLARDAALEGYGLDQNSTNDQVLNFIEGHLDTAIAILETEEQPE